MSGVNRKNFWLKGVNTSDLNLCVILIIYLKSATGFLGAGSLSEHGRISLVGFSPSVGWDLIGCS